MVGTVRFVGEKVYLAEEFALMVGEFAYHFWQRRIASQAAGYAQAVGLEFFSLTT
jgi:hypothetical protein